MDTTNNLTKKQLEIITLLYRFRFLNRSQIQQLLNHKKISQINIWLKNLNDRKIIGRNYSNKLGDNIKPAIYFLKTKSKNYLVNQLEKDDKLMKRIYGEKNRSQKFINHCLLSADFYLSLKKSHLPEEIFFYTKVDLINHDYLPLNHPDAYVAIKNGKRIKRYFLEIIDEGTPRFVIRAKIKQYLEYYSDNTWQEVTHHPFPKILILCPNDLIKKYLYTFIPRIMEEEGQEEIDFYLSTEPSNRWVSALEEIETAPEDN
ncbi:MAG: replication-relaxation family protein [Candidatus Shapirobacteria bacterium]|nr:replication-relaxation family protein [Candidatus Shapirobacteria bacterium]